MVQKIALFPLNMVLLPGAPLTLHIFEERYRLMIGRCLEQNTPFGVVLIREGDEVEEGRVGARAAVSHEIGTLAHINGSRQLDDGRYLISAVGQRRFRLQYVLQRTPYLTASVALLPEEGVADVVEQAKELRTLYERFGQAIVAATGVQAEIEDLPPDIVTMSYHLAHRLDVTNEMKQRWLEADVATRLREISALLRSELALLPQNMRTRSTDSWDGLASLN